MQKLLSAVQIAEFDHRLFEKDQVADFISLLSARGVENVTDIGGGSGYFARLLMQRAAFKVRVVDMDPASIRACQEAGVEAAQGDALAPDVLGNEEVICFNLILHHLVGATEEETAELQKQAIAAWRPYVNAVFVNEYIYDSWLGNFSGWFIFMITKNTVLSWFGRIVSKKIPSLHANTFGVGVRFRNGREWARIFDSAGFTVQSSVVGADERVSLPRRFLMIRSIHRDSFLLVPKIMTKYSAPVQ